MLILIWGINITASHSISMLKVETIWPHGVQLLDVQQSFNMMKHSIIIDVQYAGNITASNVELITIMEWVVLNIVSVRLGVKMIKNFKILSEVQSLNNVQSASFGLKELLDAHQWHADVELNFVMIVAEQDVPMADAQVLEEWIRKSE